MFLAYRWHGDLSIQDNHTAHTIAIDNPPAAVPSPVTPAAIRNQTTSPTTPPSITPLDEIKAATRLLNRTIYQAHIPEEQQQMLSNYAEQLRQMTDHIKQASTVPPNARFTRQ